MSASEEFLTHREPVWRDRSDFIINAELPEPDGRFEQLWVRRVSDEMFEVCCIPFFLYDVALGDVVETQPVGERNYVLSRVLRPSGRWVFRIWFGNSLQPRDEVAAGLAKLGVLMEWSSTNLLAVDASDPALAQRVADVLHGWEEQGLLEYETGHTG